MFALFHWPLLASLVFTLASAPVLAEKSWPRFRGPHAQGTLPGEDFPTVFGPETNLLWKISLPRGHSSPCILGDKIFLTGAQEDQLSTFAVDRGTGKILWQKSVKAGPMERGHRNGSPAASTPATDGKRVYVYFGPFGLVSYDLQGNEIWRLPLPTPVTQHGAAVSPVVLGNTVVLVCDQDVDSYVLGVDAKSGKVRWRTERPGFRRGFSTPLGWPLNKPTHAVIAGTLRVVAYNLKTGRLDWEVPGLPNEMVASPTASEDTIFVAGWTYGSGVSRLPTFDSLITDFEKNGDGQISKTEATGGPAQQHFAYIDADKNGEITRQEWDTISEIFHASQNALLAIAPPGKKSAQPKTLWKQTRGLPYVPSPLHYEGRVYLVKNGGLASCFDARTGEPAYQEERLGVLGDYYSSPIAAGGKICVASQSGTVVVWQAGPKLEILARNALGETILATPAVMDKTLYVRSENFLWAFRAGAGQ